MKLEIPTAEAVEEFLVPSRYKALYGGRGALKSHFFAGLAIEECSRVPGTRMLCIREVQKSLKESSMRLLGDKIEQHKAPGFRDKNDRIDTPGGGVMVFQGLQDHTAESIKSFEGFRIAWVNEGQTLSSRSLEILRPTMRAPGSELWFDWNPRSPDDPVDKFFRGQTPPDGAIIKRVSYLDNPWFPAELEEERKHDELTNPHRYGHIWLGEYEPAAIGALWDRLILHRNRRHEAPELAQIVVSIDPATTNEEHSDEHGIIVGAIGSDQRGYVLEDGTLKGTPQQWAQRAVTLFDKWNADSIIIEINQGGDMCKQVLSTIRPYLPIKEVHATRGKHVRAEPISALYHADRISHIGTFPKLEDQLCLITASGYDGRGSPDRADALVWAFSHLFPSIVKKAVKPTISRPIVRAGGWMA